jgi:hypothetical protein
LAANFLAVLESTSRTVKTIVLMFTQLAKPWRPSLRKDRYGTFNAVTCSMPPITDIEDHMKLLSSVIVATSLLVAGASFAQNPPAKDGPNNGAVNSEQKNSNAPVAGRNSFTEGQAKSAIEKAGYGNVTELKKDNDGVWRGKASKGGMTSGISVDFQGNVNAAK